MFQTYAPRLHRYYIDTIDKLQAVYPDFKPPFPDYPVFSMGSANFRRAIAFPHRDYANLAWGWCSITALGNFNPDKGGHLVLWECKLIIRFPPGSTILIPSAMITHFNTNIAENETRHSLVLYSAAGLFQWVYNGFQRDIDAQAKAKEVGKENREKDCARRWLTGLEMLSTLDEIYTE